MNEWFLNHEIHQISILTCPIITYYIHPFAKLWSKGMTFRFHCCHFILNVNSWQTEVNSKREATQHENSIISFVTIALIHLNTVYPKKYAHGFCFAVLCGGYTLTDFPISIRLTSLALWQSNDCPSASKATLMNMDKYFMWIHYERLHNHNKAKHNKTVCIFLGIYSTIWSNAVAWLLHVI